MRYDIWKFIGVFFVAGLVGNALGIFLISLLIAALGIICWQIYRLNLLYRWVINPHKDPLAETSGQFYLLHREVSRRNLKANTRKRQLSLLLSQFRKAMGALPDAFVLIDDNDKIQWANTHSKDVLGIQWPSDAGLRFGNLIRYPEVSRLLKDRNPPSEGTEIHPITNKEQTINIKCVRYTDSMRIIVARDVSRLIKVNQMHKDFVANVSHELKTPLTVLKGYLEILLAGDDLPQELNKPMQQMSLQSARMHLIVNDLLYLAKLEDAENTQPHKLVDVSVLLDSILESIQPLIKEKQHTLELDIDNQLKLFGTTTELHSALSNLITNAIHYTSNGGSIRVRWYLSQHKENHQAIFSVEDNGPGIATLHLDRLTQRFYRVDSNRSRESGGTGLGLAIVKHVLQRHNAELQIKSVEGEGSEFMCVFPKTQTQQRF